MYDAQGEVLESVQGAEMITESVIGCSDLQHRAQYLAVAG